MNPLDWPAAPFLLLCFALAAATLVFIARWSRNIGHRAPGSLDGLEPAHLGYLAAGPARAADTLLVALFEAGALRPDPRRRTVASFAASAQPDLPGPAGAGLPQRLHRRGYRRIIRATLAAIRDELAARRLVPDAAQALTFRLYAGSLVAALLVFGIAKIIIGASRGHPVGFLITLSAGTAIWGLFLCLSGPRRTRAGTAALRQLRRERARALRAPLGDELVLAFALTGAAVLAGRPYQPFFFTPATTGDTSSGCSTSSCSGSGCGGGCGGCS